MTLDLAKLAAAFKIMAGCCANISDELLGAIDPPPPPPPPPAPAPAPTLPILTPARLDQLRAMQAANSPGWKQLKAIADASKTTPDPNEPGDRKSVV